MKKFFYILFLGVFGLLSCSKDDTSGGQGGNGGGNVAVTAISLNPTSIIIATGEKATIVATTTPSGYEDEISWSSSNKNVATVDDGVVTAIGNGATVITAYCGNVSVKCDVTVNFSIYAAGDLYNSSDVGNGTVWMNGKSSITINSQNIMPISLSGITMAGSDVYVSGAIMNAKGVPTPYLWDDGEAEQLPANGGNGEATCCFYANGNVYAGGYINTGNKNIAAIWNDEILTTLTDGTSNSVVNAIYVDGTTVYAVGSTLPSTTGKQKAMLWKNGVQTELTDGTTTAEAQSIYVNQGNVYIGGYDNNEPMIWKNGIESQLTSQGFGGNVFGICVLGGTVYASGYIYNSSYVQLPVVWSNETMQQLSSDAGIATCIATYGSDVYAGGFIYTKGFITTSGVWKNGEFDAYSDGTTRSHIYALMIR